MEFVRTFWKNNVQEAYLPKMSISGQIVSEIVAQLCLENSIQTLLKFFGVDPEYPDKSHNFRNFIFMTSHFSILLTIQDKTELDSRDIVSFAAVFRLVTDPPENGCEGD